MTDRRVAAASSHEHYSRAHYADEAVAEGFDELRFGGPVGRHLLETQARLLADVLAPERGTTVLDVGTGTGRAAIGLATAGARVWGLDRSVRMLEVARRRSQEARTPVRFGVADAHELPVGDRAVDAVVSLRLLMHAVDWRACLGELCRVARWRVVVDFPAVGSGAAFESAARHAAAAVGLRTEAYRVMAERAVAHEFGKHGFRVVLVARQFVMPIAIHKAIGRLSATLAVERALAAVGLLRLLGSPVTMVAER